ncbi:hypothetical protein DDE01_18790 [Desulfovibrio desulfuricans]|nr:hypothetical protein DDE01_18790 [Desulfovibrio desulfuricans]
MKPPRLRSGGAFHGTWVSSHVPVLRRRERRALIERVYPWNGASVHLWPPSLETEATGRNAYLAGNIHGMTYACKVTSTQMTSVMAMLCLSAKRNRAPS